MSVTALDRLRSDPYQFYASSILRLKELDPLDAEPTPAWQGILAHAILEEWHKSGRQLSEIASEKLTEMNAHPLMRALWRPRLLKALEWIESRIADDPGRVPTVIEDWGSMDVKGVRDWGEVRALVLESYRLIAPKALWAVVQGTAPAGEKASPRPRRAGTARRRSRSGATRR